MPFEGKKPAVAVGRIAFTGKREADGESSLRYGIETVDEDGRKTGYLRGDLVLHLNDPANPSPISAAELIAFAEWIRTTAEAELFGS